MEAKRITEENDLMKAFHIRKEVFVEEQGVPLEDEFDEYDNLYGQCEHVLVYYNEQSVGTGRVRFVEHFAKLERICILKPYRKFGIGKIIIKALEEIAEKNGVTKIKLHGQTHAEEFYKKLGYQTSSNMFMEDGIPHILMGKDLSNEKAE